MTNQLTLEKVKQFNDNFIITAETIETDYYTINEHHVFSYHSSENEYSDEMNFLVTLKNKHTNEIVYQHRYSNDDIINSLLTRWTNLYIECESLEQFIEKVKNQ